MNSQKFHSPSQPVIRRARLAGRILGLASVAALAGALAPAHASSTATPVTTLPLSVNTASFANGLLNFSNFQSTNAFIPHTYPQGTVVGDGADITVSLQGIANNQITLRFEEANLSSPLLPDYLRNLTFQASPKGNFAITGVTLTPNGFTASGDYSGYAAVDIIGKNGLQPIATNWASINVTPGLSLPNSTPGLSTGAAPSLFDIEWYLVKPHQGLGGSGTFKSLDATFTVSSVPEPATNAMMALGLLMLGGLSLKKRRS